MAKANDGSDFKHRQRILPHYQNLALSKRRLKFVIVLHMLLSFLMMAKMVSTVLDLLNIFWQPIEELYIPMARPWEWLWLSSLPVASLGLRAMKSNNGLQVKMFLLGIIITCILPITYCAYFYSTDFRTFVITKDAQKTSEVWRNYPVALYWYLFIGVAAQVHGFEMYFGFELLKSMTGQRLVNKSK